MGYTRTAITVIGEYYFEEFFLYHPWLTLPQPVSYPSSPYCVPGGKKLLHVPHLLNLGVVAESERLIDYDTLLVHSAGHLLSTDSGGKNSSTLQASDLRTATIKVLLSISIEGLAKALG